MKISTNKAYEALYRKLSDERYRQAQNELSNRWEQSQWINANLLLGHPVIAISNEWCNPVIGFVTKIQSVSIINNPVPVIHDYVENREVLSMAIVRFYSDQLFDVMMRLDPFERWAMIADTHSHLDYTKEKRESIMSKEMLVQRLTDNGFINRWLAYKDSGI